MRVLVLRQGGPLFGGIELFGWKVLVLRGACVALLFLLITDDTFTRGARESCLHDKGGLCGSDLFVGTRMSCHGTLRVGPGSASTVFGLKGSLLVRRGTGRTVRRFRSTSGMRGSGSGLTRVCRGVKIVLRSSGRCPRYVRTCGRSLQGGPGSSRAHCGLTLTRGLLGSRRRGRSRGRSGGRSRGRSRGSSGGSRGGGRRRRSGGSRRGRGRRRRRRGGSRVSGRGTRRLLGTIVRSRGGIRSGIGGRLRVRKGGLSGS